MKKLYIPIIIFLGMSINAFSQEKSAQELKGDKHYFVYSFDKAIKDYKSDKQLSVEGQRKLAKSYSNMNQNAEAELAYSKLISTPGGNLAEDYFNYAMVLKANGKYEEANIAMDKFQELKPTDLRAKDYANNKATQNILLTDNGKYKIEQLTANTDAQDFGTSYYKDKIVFTSSRTSKLISKKSNRNGKPYLNMYVAEVDNNQLKTPVNFDKKLNGKMNDGPASFNKEGTFMAFTENNYDLKKKELIVNLEIYFRTYADGKWSKPEPFALNNKKYSVGHPSLSFDGKTMYFSSDMPGGYGGVDIYKTTKNADGKWSQAENLGDKINTEGDEMFPFYEENHGTFFFTSNGRSGLGGMDIFSSEIKGSTFGVATNLGAPMNTRYDDFALITDANMEKGYFSSDRVGGKGDDDIYSFSIEEIKKQLQGIAKDTHETIIPNTFITLLDDKGVILDTITTKSNGAYTFQVATGKNFKLTGSKNNYADGENTANTNGKELVVIADVTLLKKEEVIAQKIIPGADLAKIVEVNSIYFDLDKYNIRPDAEVELKKIIKIMNEYPKMVIELGSYTDCRETQAYNQILSDKRAKASVAFIKKGITNPERITGKGYSKTKLVNDCSCDGNIVSDCSEEQHQKNRRTEFIIKSKGAIAKK